MWAEPCPMGAVLMPMAQTTQRNWFDSSTVSKKEDTSWSENLMGAVQRTVIISEILDSRTRHLIQAGAAPLHLLSSLCSLDGHQKHCR